MLTIASFLLLGLSSFYANAQIDYIHESPEQFQKHMEWFKNAKFGMFIHFGLYSSLEGEYQGKVVDGYAEWIQAHADIPADEYAKLQSSWNPYKFNADKIVRLAKKAGMQYLVVTSRHHEGFCLWDSAYTDYDIAGTMVKGRDFMKELSEACKKYGIHFGTYYSIIDWHHPSQMRNADGKDSWGWWAQITMKEGRKAEYVTYMKNQIKELIENYDSEILWFDGEWADWWTLEDGKDLYNYIRNLNPDVIVANRVAKREQFQKDFGTPEQSHPDTSLDYYWEACYTMNNSWGYKRSDKDWKSPDTIVDYLNDINEKGGNLLLNIGPDRLGTVPPEAVKILKSVGKKLHH